MNLEMPNLQPVTPDKKSNLPEKTSSDLESPAYTEYLALALHKKGEAALAELVQDGKINVELLRRKAVSTGDAAEKFAENQGSEFFAEEHMKMRAEMDAEEIIANKDKYLQ